MCIFTRKNQDLKRTVFINLLRKKKKKGKKGLSLKSDKKETDSKLNKH